MPTWNFGPLPSDPSGIAPNEYLAGSNVILRELEIGPGWVTIWGLGDVTMGPIKSELAFRTWYHDVYRILPYHIKSCQEPPIGFNGLPKTVEKHNLFHPDGYVAPSDPSKPGRHLNHVHIVYPYTEINDADIFELRLLFNQLGWFQPLTVSRFLDRISLPERENFLKNYKDDWADLILPPKFLPPPKFL
jgi:hypothetical protein